MAQDYNIKQVIGDTVWLTPAAGFYWDTINLTWAKASGGAAGSPSVSVDNFPASYPVTGPLTDAQLRATPVPVSGTVTASGPLTDAQLRATPVPVSGTVTASGPLTDAQLRASAVPVSISASVPVTGPLTDAELRAVPVPVSGTVTANPATSFGKTITYVPVAQGAAGTTVLAAADGTKKHKIIGGMLTMSLAGTLKFNDGVADLTGPMTFAANGGMVVPESAVPFCETGAINRAMNLITTVGAANGVIAILTEA